VPTIKWCEKFHTHLRPEHVRTETVGSNEALRQAYCSLVNGYPLNSSSVPVSITGDGIFENVCIPVTNWLKPFGFKSQEAIEECCPDSPFFPLRNFPLGL